MTRNLVILTGALLALAACAEPNYTPVATTPVYSGSSTPPVYAAPAAPAYGGTVVMPECAARPADPLHQNRIGGSDYNPDRCRQFGY